MIVLLVGLGLVGCGPPAVVEPGAVVLDLDRAGPRVSDDVELAEAMTGDAVPGEELIRAASCHNAVRANDDVSLNLSPLVAARADLVRVVELVADGRVSAELAEVMESSWWTGGDVVADAQEAGFSADEIDKFERLIAQPPSDAALDRFVVYVVSGDAVAPGRRASGCGGVVDFVGEVVLGPVSDVGDDDCGVGAVRIPDE